MLTRPCLPQSTRSPAYDMMQSLMSDYKIPLSKTLLFMQIVDSAVLVIRCCILVTLFFTQIVTTAPAIQALPLTVMWVLLPSFWLVGSAIAVKKWPKTVYTFTDTALQVQSKGLLGNTSE